MDLTTGISPGHPRMKAFSSGVSCLAEGTFVPSFTSSSQKRPR